LQHLVAVQAGQIQVEQHQYGFVGPASRVIALAEQVVNRLLAVVDDNDIVRNARATQVFFNQAGMARIVFHQKNSDLLPMWHSCLLS
jgi:hypothetical protein